MKNTFGRYRLLLIVVIVPFLLLSCYHSYKTENEIYLKSVIDTILGKKLRLPDKLIVYKPFDNLLSDSLTIFNSKYKIFTYLDASCGSCITHIKLWENIVDEFYNYKVPIILICESDDNFELLKYLCETGIINKFSYPFFLCRTNDYISKNKYMVEVQDFRTVLTDNENHILLLGNPLNSETIKDLYFKVIEK